MLHVHAPPRVTARQTTEATGPQIRARRTSVTAGDVPRMGMAAAAFRREKDRANFRRSVPAFSKKTGPITLPKTNSRQKAKTHAAGTKLRISS